MEGEEIPEIAERGGSSMRSRERWLEALSYSELRGDLTSAPRKTGEKMALYIRGAVGLVPLGRNVA